MATQSPIYFEIRLRERRASTRRRAEYVDRLWVSYIPADEYGYAEIRSTLEFEYESGMPHARRAEDVDWLLEIKSNLPWRSPADAFTLVLVAHGNRFRSFRLRAVRTGDGDRRLVG
jgi:hypothetical protein